MKRLYPLIAALYAIFAIVASTWFAFAHGPGDGRDGVAFGALMLFIILGAGVAKTVENFGDDAGARR